MKEIQESIKYACQSTTGRNLRELMSRFGKDTTEDLDMELTDCHLYERITNDEKWRVDITNELVNVRHGIKILANFGYEDKLTAICTSFVHHESFD